MGIKILNATMMTSTEMTYTSHLNTDEHSLISLIHATKAKFGQFLKKKVKIRLRV